MIRHALRCSIVLAAALTSCGPSDGVPPQPPGEPLIGLSADEQARFEAGKALFNRIFTAADGLGPLFNDNQCSACHTSPATGGTGDQFVTRASRFQPPDRCDMLDEAGGENVRIQATPQLHALGVASQPFPAAATERVDFNVPYVFGLGLVDAIPEDAITAHADPRDLDGDGISGRPGRDRNGRFARFGRKADVASLRDFVENAAHLEMGLTTPSRPHEIVITNAALQGAESTDGALSTDIDPAPDPELDEDDVALLTDFVRFLGPLAPRTGVDAADSERIAQGEQLFHAIGCSSCHVPAMTTGRSETAALDRKRVALYSDLLLHDMGPGLANVCAPGATPTEMRTDPLMGLGRRSLYLHDSRTNDLQEAIGMHGGEATLVRERFRALGELERHALIRFLRSL